MSGVVVPPESKAGSSKSTQMAERRQFERTVYHHWMDSDSLMLRKALSLPLHCRHGVLAMGSRPFGTLSHLLRPTDTFECSICFTMLSSQSPASVPSGISAMPKHDWSDWSLCVTDARARSCWRWSESYSLIPTCQKFTRRNLGHASTSNTIAAALPNAHPSTTHIRADPLDGPVTAFDSRRAIR